ncbi:MAG: RluA family pseudouridine synthase [Deltaproteobacteria bacterium]|nr:RluA family pseudouridine synthase [Deltaproteobacteria bacterium]
MRREAPSRDSERTLGGWGSEWLDGDRVTGGVVEEQGAEDGPGPDGSVHGGSGPDGSVHGGSGPDGSGHGPEEPELMAELIDIPFDVLSHEHGTRLDVFLSRRIQRMSRSLASRIIRERLVRIGQLERAAKPSDLVLEGQQVLLRRRKLDEPPADDIDVPIVYEDDWFLGVNKPGDLVVHPTASAYHRTLIRVLRTRLRDETLDLAHRIDKETSGLVLVARHLRASAALKTLFAERRVKKSYLAVVRGVPDWSARVLDAPMRLVPESRSGVAMEVGGEGAMEALTEFTVLARGPTAALVEARPHTGRQHQIRVHLQHLGHPIIGDKLYLGGEDFFIAALRGGLSDEELVSSVGHTRHALHAFRATFVHPKDREVITVSAGPRQDLVELARSLGLEMPSTF